MKIILLVFEWIYSICVRNKRKLEQIANSKDKDVFADLQMENKLSLYKYIPYREIKCGFLNSNKYIFCVI